MPNQEINFYPHLRSIITKWANTEEGKTNKWTEYLLFAPDLFRLLCKLSIDNDVPPTEKAKLAGAIAYFVSPLDLIPEALVGPKGFRDDIALAAYVLNSIVSKTNSKVVRKHWDGHKDVLEVIQQILKVAKEMVGSDLWPRLKKIVD